jgi:hypothetical protein
MIYYPEYAYRVVALWRRRFYLSEIGTRFNQLFVAHDVLMQTSRKCNFEYVIAFGNILWEILKEFVKYF